MEDEGNAPRPDGKPPRLNLTLALVILGVAAWLGAAIYAASTPDTPDNLSLVGLVAIIGLVLLAFAAVRGLKDFLGRAMVGFATSAGWTPLIAVLATIVALYAVPDPSRLGQRGFAVMVGIGAALVGWVILAFLGSFHNVPDRVNIRVYSDVSEAYRGLRRRLEAFSDRQGTAAYRIAETQLDWLGECVGIGDCESPAKADVDWATGYRYIGLWSAVYRIEESLLDLVADDELYAEVRIDQLRLGGSSLTGIEKRLDELIKVLAPPSSVHESLAVLRADIRAAVEQLPGDPASDERRLIEQRLASVQQRLHALELEPTLLTGGTAGTNLIRSEARAIRRAINEFRLGRMDGLVRARNRLARTTNATAWAIFLVLVSAIALGALRENLVAALVFFAVGAVIGLFAELRADASREEAIEDYGLSAVRLRQTALASGLAAVAGVVLTAIAISTTDTGAEAQRQSLTQIFNAGDRPGQLLIAAVFGLSPHVLIERLTSTAEQYRKELSQTAAGEPPAEKT